MMMGHRTTWEASRWQTYCILSALGCKNISQPADLVSFPWEKEEIPQDPPPSKEELENIRQQLKALNERNAKKNNTGEP